MIRPNSVKPIEPPDEGAVPQRIHSIKQNGLKLGLNFTESSSIPKQQHMSNNPLKNNN
jgi:hypothetical protein